MQLSREQSSNSSYPEEQNITNEEDINLVEQSLNIFGNQPASSQQPGLAAGSSIIPQRYANLGQQQQGTQQQQQASSQGVTTQQQQFQQQQQNYQQNPQNLFTNMAQQQVQLSVQVKIPEPKAFSGERKDAKTWLSRLDRYFAACGWQEASHTAQMNAIAQALMSDAASRWLDRLHKLQQLPSTYAEFKQSFTAQFTVLDDENIARDKLKEAKQKGNINSYIQYFDSIVLDLPSAQQEDLVHNFCYGLKSPVKGLVKAQIAGQQNVQLSDVMTLALQFEDSMKASDANKGTVIPKVRTQNSTQQSRNGPVPMELGNIQDDQKGASRSFISPQMVDSLQPYLEPVNSVDSLSVILPNGTRVTSEKSYLVRFKIQNNIFTQQMFCLDINSLLILGNDFLKQYQVSLDYADDTAYLRVQDMVISAPLVKNEFQLEEDVLHKLVKLNLKDKIKQVSRSVFGRLLRKSGNTAQVVMVRPRQIVAQQQPTYLNMTDMVQGNDKKNQKVFFANINSKELFADVELKFLADFVQHLGSNVDQFLENKIFCQYLKDFNVSMNLLRNKFYVNQLNGRENFARQYQRSDFAVNNTTNLSERKQIFINNTFEVHSIELLKKCFEQPGTLFVGNMFQCKNRDQLKQVQSLLSANVLLNGFEIIGEGVIVQTPNISVQLKKSGSPLAFLQDLLFHRPGLPAGAVQHLLSANADVAPELSTLLQEYADVFPDALPVQQPPDRGLGDTHHIPLIDGAKPVHKKMYRTSPQEQLLIKAQIEELLEAGAIRPSASPWGSPVLFVRKPDGSLRFCVDYRALNALTVKDRYPLPRPEDLIDQLRGAKYFSSLDLRSGYWQSRVAEEDIHKTAFLTRYGQFEWVVMPFGLTNAPATFMRAMNNLFVDLLDRGVVCFLDDVLIYSDSVESHVALLKNVFNRLREYKYYCKLKKCAFFKEQTTFLGFDVSANGVNINTDKVDSVVKWPVPKNVQQVQSFVGFVQFFRKFIKGFSLVAEPLTRLTRKGIVFEWGMEQQEAFEQLRAKVTAAPVLQVFDPHAELEVHTDASAKAIGAALFQKTSGAKHFHPVAFFSRRLNQAQQNYSATDREMLAIVESSRHWRHYLHGQNFVVRTDHKPLTYFFSQPNLSSRQLRWLEALSEFMPGMSLQYTQGSSHIVPDRLSRRHDYLHGVADAPSSHPDSLLAPSSRADLSDQVDPAAVTKPSNQFSMGLANLSTVNSNLLTRIRTSQEADTSLGRKWELARSSSANWSVRSTQQGDVLLFQDKFYIPVALREDLVREYHDNRGHFGAKRTTEMLRKHFSWEKMSEYVVRFCRRCEECARQKADTNKKYGFQQNIPIPDQPWEVIHIDFVTDLPKVKNFDCVMTVVDRFSKYAIFVPLNNTQASHVAEQYFDKVVTQHGFPRAIISDRDPRFTGNFWKSLMKLFHTELWFSTSFHPQTDGMAEVTNRTLEQLIRLYCNDDRSNWLQKLSLIQMYYNCTPQSRTGFSPYFVLTGREMKLPVDIELDSVQVPASQNFASSIVDVWQSVKQKLQHSQNYSKKNVDAKRRQVDFQVGDMVLLSTRNLKLRGQSSKLQPRFIGPFPVLEFVGENAVRLKLPENSKMHDVFNVSLCKKYFGQQVVPSAVEVDGEAEYEIDRILTHRVRGRSLEYLIRWKGYDQSEDCWLKESDLVNAPDILKLYKRQQQI